MHIEGVPVARVEPVLSGRDVAGLGNGKPGRVWFYKRPTAHLRIRPRRPLEGLEEIVTLKADKWFFDTKPTWIPSLRDGRRRHAYLPQGKQASLPLSRTTRPVVFSSLEAEAGVTKCRTVFELGLLILVPLLAQSGTTLNNTTIYDANTAGGLLLNEFDASQSSQRCGRGIDDRGIANEFVGIKTDAEKLFCSRVASVSRVSAEF